MRLPTESEINIFNSLDEIEACRHFLNKTIQEGEELFRQDSLMYQEDLMWMGPYAFNFYLQSVINYIEHDGPKVDIHFIDCLYAVVKFRVDEKMYLLPIQNLVKLVNCVINNFNQFEIDSVIYDGLLEKYLQLKEELNLMNKE